MDGRLEKIRRFEGSVMDFDSYVKDRIEQTKKENTCTSQTDKAKRKKRVDEKLNIQPVSKERLNSRILETDGWKSKLKTGDFITITTKTKDTIGNILKKANSYIFVSLNDYQDYYEGDILDIGESAEKECGGGILVTSDRFDNLIYIPLARFEDDRMYLISIPHNIGKERMITRILRIPNLKQPLDRNFFISKTVDVSKCVQIYNRA